MGALRSWANGRVQSMENMTHIPRRRIEQFKELVPHRDQRNLTVFRLVPVSVFLSEVEGAIELHADQEPF